MPTVPITRRLEFDAAHRIPGHESKCRAIHGHRYVVEITVQGDDLDDAGRVIDFGKVKEIIGGWIDTHWDHTLILCEEDDTEEMKPVIKLNESVGRPVYFMDEPPTVENMVAELANASCYRLQPLGLKVLHIRLYETPNCWADWQLGFHYGPP